mmetsp:Transcript_30779/g.65457  ORF Transcript_30779/g.65457 Transcript_30779/m.65457 type:complete len:752 (+) Transcript_30779:29-2284(+)|eukprot:CAMPEP_0172551210 /NCGR_PEP_ID=MMETSP1067-20121228/36686_1 /TAXON_ID=265564 ORGANISM="Thalassiosira punctigera, Strain Tpunct2005C2" /NCGR_SAMPLE_ID=MMETSP1067 /ASSEMBLY_ACC=CAM_ASM_000444 /LENGTH=751 /DNA_ID=CAMNT_0013338967 /DNA_START=29 /DNA_END=2284 /DNA_ORIENTATION=+
MRFELAAAAAAILAVAPASGFSGTSVGSSRSLLPGAGSSSSLSPLPKPSKLALYSTIEKAASSAALSDKEILAELERAAEDVASDLLDEECLVDQETGGPVDELCVDEGLYRRTKDRFKKIVRGTLSLTRSGTGESDEVESSLDFATDDDLFGSGVLDGEEVPEGEILEQGWEKRGNSSALRRNAEVWKFALKCVFKTLKARKLTKAGADETAISKAKVEAATFIRDGLLRLGPTFVKLGQVVSTRTDVLPTEFTNVLKTLQDDVPGFSGKRAKAIVSKELGKPCDDVFQDFSMEPLAAASLGQVHTAIYKGKKVAIKVQRAGLKELFDVDLKNLKKLAIYLDKFDPKTDGADRDWVSIYEESERLLYLEIDYLNEAANCERFARDFKDVDWVRVPEVYREVSTPRVLTMEFIDSFKLTDIKRVEQMGLDRELLAKRTADAFLRQIVETGYFHCDPHPGNLCVDVEGNLVYYDFGMMDELKPNVRSGFRKFCTALFAGGPVVGDMELAENAKVLVDGVEEAGVLARGADRLAVEKLARYFMRTFKDSQLGKKGANIKETVGTDLQTLTENDVFRFPSTFTFIFRSFASIDGIGKGLSGKFDIGKLAQPFIEKFTEVQKNETPTQKSLRIFSKATGLNQADINKALTSPKKIAYIEETLREIERGDLKIRVRSLENEKALERMSLTQGKMEKLLVASLLLNLAGMATSRVLAGAGVVGAAAFGLQAFMANAKITKFDKTQAKFVSTKFVDDE